MITIEVYPWVRQVIPNNCEQTSFKCPFCRVKHTTFVTINRCKYCSNGLVDIMALMGNKNYSLEYHFNKVNDDGSINTEEA